VEARGEATGAAFEQDEKHGVEDGGDSGQRWAAAPFYRGGGGKQWRGAGESGDVWGGVGEGEGGPAVTEIGSGGRHRPLTGGRGRRRCRTTAAGRVRLTGDTWRLRGPAGSDGVRGEHGHMTRR
jgi:hypothetical protein